MAVEMNGALEHGFEISTWLAGLIVTLISVIYMDLRKQIQGSLEELKAQVQRNIESLEANTKSSLNLSSEIAVISEKLLGLKREQAVSAEGLNQKIEAHESKHIESDLRFERIRDRIHELSNHLNQLSGILHLYGISLDTSGNMKLKNKLE